MDSATRVQIFYFLKSNTGDEFSGYGIWTGIVILFSLSLNAVEFVIKKKYLIIAAFDASYSTKNNHIFGLEENQLFIKTNF